MIPLDSFVGQSADGKMVPIIPGGNSIPLTFSNRKEYVERAIEYRLHEMDRQVRGNILRGSHERFERFAFDSKQELSGFYWILVYEFTGLINLYLYFSPYSETFQAISQDLPFTQGLRWALNWPLFGLEAKPSARPSEPAFSLSPVLSLICLHVLLSPNPVSCSSSVSQGPCEWIPEDWPCNPIWGPLSSRSVTVQIFLVT